MYSSFSVSLASPAETATLGRVLGEFCVPGVQFCLKGPLGAGKSTLARAIIEQACGPQDDIPSPTFTLVQPYQSHAGHEIWHMDLYRLKVAEDALALGIEEAFFKATCLIEWPDKLAGYVPSSAMIISLSITGDTSRQVDISAPPFYESQLASVLHPLIS